MYRFSKKNTKNYITYIKIYKTNQINKNKNTNKEKKKLNNKLINIPLKYKK